MEEWQNAFGGALERLFQDDEFNSEFTPDQYGLVIQGALNRFAEKYEISDKSQLEKIAQEKHQELRNRRGITRFQPKEEEFSQYYVPFDIDESKPISERIESIDDWVRRSVDKASSVRASEREDFEYHLRDIANNYIRQEKAKEEKPGLIGDHFKRIVEGAVKPTLRIFDDESVDRYFAEHLVEDPERDEDLSAKFMAGIGEYASILTIGGGLTLAGQPQAIPAVFGALYGARYMREGYYEEMKRSGNKELALDHAISQTPAAALDTFSEVFLFGAGRTGKVFYKQFLEATTEEAKRAVLKKAIPSIVKEGGLQFLGEGVVGGAGADFASGIGSFLATRDQKYLDNATNIKQLAESAFIEGTLGAGFGMGLTAIGKNSETKGVAEQIRNLTLSSDKDQQFVFEALKRKDYDSVMNFLSNNIEVKDESEYDVAVNLLKENTGKTPPTQEPKKENQTKEEEKARTSVSNSRYLINLRKRLRDIEGDSVKEDEANRLKENIKSIQQGRFVEKEEFDSEIDEEEVSGYQFSGFDPSKEQQSGVYNITLEDGNKLEDDENVVYLKPNNFTNKETFNTLELTHGVSPTIIFSPNKDTAKVVLPGTGKGSEEISASSSPRKGWIPVRVTSEQKEGGYKTKVSFLPKVSESNKLKLDPNKYQVIGRDDKSITIKHEGKTYKLTGSAANYVASQQEIIENREVVKALNNKENSELVLELWDKATENKWTEEEKKYFLDNVDKAVDILDKLSKVDKKDSDTYIEMAISLLDAKDSLSKIRPSEIPVSLLNTKEEDVIEETVEEKQEEPVKTTDKQVVQKKPSPHKLSITDTLDTATKRSVYFDGRQGKIVNENGDFLFVSNSGVVYDLGTQRGDLTLEQVGVSVKQPNKLIKKNKVSVKSKPVVLEESVKKEKQETENKEGEPGTEDPKEIPPQTETEQPTQQPRPEIRTAFVNHAIKLARSVDNRLSGDYLANNKFTKEELEAIGEYSGIDVAGKDVYQLADELNAKLGKVGEKLDRRKDNEFKKVGDRLRKSKATIGSEGKREAKIKVLEKLKRSFNFDKVVIVNTQNDLPKEINIEDGEIVEGFAYNDGSIYIVLDNIEDSQQEIERVFIHELFGHLGVSSVLKGISFKGYLSLKSKIQKYRNGDLWNSIKEKYKESGKEDGKENKKLENVWLDESIAHIFNDRRPAARSIVRALLDKIRIALVKAGIKNWSNNDIEALIRETFANRKFDSGVSIRYSSSARFSKKDKISSGDIANHSIISHYGAWIDKSGNLFLIDGESNDFPHYEKALEILEIKDDNNITDVYEQMYKKGYVSIRKNQGDGYVEAGTGRNLTISQKATLENIGINDEIRIILDNGVSGTKTIYSPPTANDLARFSKKQENEQSFDNSLDAGGGFIFAMQKPINNKIGKHTIPNHGIVSEDQFKKIALGSNEILPKHEFEFYKLLVPSAFSEKGVDVNELYEGLKEINNSITVEVYGQNGNVSEAKTELDRMTHEWLEMEFNHDQRAIISSAAQGTSQDRKIAFHHVTDRQAEKLKVFFELTDKVASEPSDTSLRATSHYDTVSPYDTKKFPVLRVDVVLQNKLGENKQFVQEEQAAIQKLQNRNYSPVRDKEGKIVKLKDTASGQEVELNKLSVAINALVENANEASRLKNRDKDKEITLWQQDNLHENLPNTLGWAMVQFVPDPKTGETVAFVGEQQSRWGQTVQKAEQAVKKGNPDLRDIQQFENSHPLLESQANLVLKAVIREAQKRGVKKVVVSDGETAMMTERHDTQGGFRAVAPDNKEIRDNLDAQTAETLRRKGWKIEGPQQPEQAGGMRLHYDTTLPSAMKKLTGDKGEAWDGGMHKNVKLPIFPDKPFYVENTGSRFPGAFENYFKTREEAEQYIETERIINEDFNDLGLAIRDRTKEIAAAGSLVFRSADGSPKTNVTGRIYDISNVSNKNIRFSKASENTARFNELTDDLYQGRDSATQDEIDAWKEKNPEKWDELSKMRERVLKVARRDDISISFPRPTSKEKFIAEIKRLGVSVDDDAGYTMRLDAPDGYVWRANGETGYSIHYASNRQTWWKDAFRSEWNSIQMGMRMANEAEKAEARHNNDDDTWGAWSDPIAQGPKVTPDQWADIDNKDIRFSKGGNIQEQSSFDNSLFNDFILMTSDKVSKRREISKLKSKKLEAKLNIGEKQVYDALKAINPLHLNEEHLEKYHSLLKNFVETRTRVDNPPLERDRIETILSEISEITNHQNEQIYDKYAKEFPDIEGIDFRKGDGTLDMHQLQDWVASRIELDDVLDAPRLISESHSEYIEAVSLLQQQLEEEINDPDSIIYSMVNKEEGIIDTGNPLLDKGNNIIRERLNDIKQHLNDFVSQLLQFDPIEATFKETRVNYYSLMSILGDGYPLKSGSFISARTKRILESEGNKFVNPYSEKQTESWLDKAMSFGTKIRRIAGNDNSLKALYDLVAPFREGIFNAQRWTTEVARPYLDNALSEAEKIQGRHFNDIDRIKMGIYALLRRHHITEKPEDGLKRNIEWIKKSIDNYKNSYDKGLAESASRQESIIDLLTNGIDFDSEYAMLELENNAKAILGDGAVKLVSDIVVLFDTLKPLSRVSTEVVYGRPFAEVVNYIPSMQMIIKGSHSELDMSDISMSADNISIANGSVGSNDIINTKGMSTTKDWLRKIGTNRALALDVMLLADNVGRLAALDYFTSFERREIHNMMISNTKISKKLAEFLGDKNDDLGRTSLFNNATRTMWQNELENHTFVAPIQGIANKFVNWWARGRLSGIHQLFSQTLSNYAPFFVANINNPRKIARSFEAFGLMLKYNAGLTTEAQNKVIEKITYEIKHRAQDTFLDKSANLNIKGSEFKSWFKGTGFYHAIRETDDVLEKILFAPFKWSDYISGTPILLAEYLDNEIQRTGVTSMSFDDMVYNMESHHRAVDETERFIGIGNGSRRAEWFHNRDGLIAFSRNLLTAFSSHRINNATNFNSELRRLTEHDLSPEEKAKSLRYMAGIAAQTVVFGGVKFLIQAFIAKAIVNAIRSDDDDDDLEELYLEREGMSKEEKAIINTEISFRRQVRSQINKLKDRTENYEGLAVSLAKDGIINMFIIPSFGEMAVDAIIHLGYDSFQKENFNEFKEEEIKRLKKLYKEEKGDGQETEVSARIAEDISDLESQVYFPVTFETRTVAPLGGSFGGVMRGLEDAAETSINNFIRMKPVSTKDILNYLSIIGVAQPDITKLVNELDKIEKLKEEQSKKLEKIEEESEETNVFSF